jgi:alkylated DNA nucleotide flippase Atl1
MISVSIAPLTKSPGTKSHVNRALIEEGRYIHPWYRYADAKGRIPNQTDATKKTLKANGTHLNAA